MVDIKLKIERVADELANWRKTTGIPEGEALSSAQRSQLIAYTYDCIDRMGYELRASRSNATVIPYTGAMTVNGVTKNVWEIVDIITKQSPEKYMYISDTPAGQFINSDIFESALVKAVGSKSIAETKHLTGQVYCY